MYISGFGSYHPPTIVTNEQLARTVDTTAEWIDSRTGISERRIADDSITVADMGRSALLAACDDAGWDPASIDVLICSTCSPDYILSSVAAQIGGRMGIDAISFDVGAACSGFIFGFEIARGFLDKGRHRRVALVAAEKMSAVVEPGSRSAVYFGDSAGVVLLTNEQPAWGAEIVDLDLRSFNAHYDRVIAERQGWFWQDAPFVYDFALKSLVEAGRDMLAAHDLESKDLTAVIGHQANLRLLQHVMSELDITESQHWHNVEVCGNQASAGVATVLSSFAAENRSAMHDGDLVTLQTVGAGFALGTALLRWTVGDDVRQVV